MKIFDCMLIEWFFEAFGCLANTPHLDVYFANVDA